MKHKPFLKWPGGKFRLLDAILQALPCGERLVEPFVGSGAVFLNAPFHSFMLCDSNGDLIALFQHLNMYGKEYIEYCKTFFSSHNNCDQAYYHLRERFNSSTDQSERAALFLYLNRHSFNGLVRYNSRGGYNAPFGKYKKVYFPHAELLHFHSKTQECTITFAVQDFQITFAQLRPSDVVYADPPYVPLSPTANFTSYAGTSFAKQAHRVLAQLAQKAWSDGIPVLLSNHDTVLTRELYAQAKIQEFTVQRYISCNGKSREKVPELLAAYLV